MIRPSGIVAKGVYLFGTILVAGSLILGRPTEAKAAGSALEGGSCNSLYNTLISFVGQIRSGIKITLPELVGAVSPCVIESVEGFGYGTALQYGGDPQLKVKTFQDKMATALAQDLRTPGAEQTLAASYAIPTETPEPKNGWGADLQNLKTGAGTQTPTPIYLMPNSTELPTSMDDLATQTYLNDLAGGTPVPVGGAPGAGSNLPKP